MVVRSAVILLAENQGRIQLSERPPGGHGSSGFLLVATMKAVSVTVGLAVRAR